MIRRLLKKILGNNYNENNASYIKINFAINILMFIISAVMLLFLPEQIPILHEGAKNYNVPSILGVWLFPILGLVNNFSLIKQKRLGKFNSFVFVILCIIMTGYYINMV
ncbi:hypothetical protein [Clostridium sp. BNL1100]|uniref:hypothetical protein n=1 Tax=Clostridium sp. BNL1100 TaxID=755731 RepID=UPI00024A785B|nr:hypothetical protein [Clostridium sp. BNL1100]AEY67390.1 hypothetical protein Clo1100_3243 [Clostridium sp. BNL1100]